MIHKQKEHPSYKTNICRFYYKPNKYYIGMPALTIRYRKSLALNLTDHSIRFAESTLAGHRVQIPMSVDDLNAFFIWRRVSGSPRPIGHFLPEIGGIKFSDVLIQSLNKSYNDMDGVYGGLNYSSYILDCNDDSRIRKNRSVSANDLVMAYVLYKCYDSSAAPTMNIVYNLEDAYCMLDSETVANVIVDSFKEEELLTDSSGIDLGAVNAMFRTMLSLNPLRYFQANGTQVPGLFETNYVCSCDPSGNPDPSASGPWNFIENDTLEVRIEFTFPKPVTRISADDAGNKETIVIPTGTVFAIRLQILAVDTPSGSGAKQAVAAAAAAAAIAAQTSSAAAAAQAAAVYAAMAVEQQQQAAYITTQEDTIYANAVADAARQAIAAANAQAAATAAQAALEQAIINGNSIGDIQNLRNLYVAASAAATQSAAIAAQASITVQIAQTNKATAAQALATAQQKTADAVAVSATANLITAAAALAKAQADAAVLAASKALLDGPPL